MFDGSDRYLVIVILYLIAQTLVQFYRTLVNNIIMLTKRILVNTVEPLYCRQH